VAASVILAWSGVNAVNTVTRANAGSPAEWSPPGTEAKQFTGFQQIAERPPEPTPAAGPNDAESTSRLGTLPAPGPPGAGPTAAGDSREVSLADAGKAEVGGAAGSQRNGSDRSAALSERGAIDPASVLADGQLSLGGCLPEYGAAGQCLPAVPPSMSAHLQDMKAAGLDPASMKHSWSCDEVNRYFHSGLPLRTSAVDPQRLDTNNDGVACGPGD
jgi:hypothetical protein